MIIDNISQLPVSSSGSAIFCDFDGTVAQQDVGYRLFTHFSDGRNNALLPDWKSKKLSTRECLVMEAELVNAPCEEILSFIDQFELDSGFSEFVARCRSKDIPVVVISEGLDLYICHLLTKFDLAELPVICNRGRCSDGRIEISFPFSNANCRWCGSCKGERMAEYRKLSGGVKVVFVGDGYSDACAADEADILLAKKDLVTYCNDNDIPYNAFNTFDDVGELLFGSDRSLLW